MRVNSYEQTKMENCGAFNVLIGKNNAGKSNVLSATKFFDCMKANNVVTLAPPTGKPIDLFEKKSDAPIEIAAGFALSSEEQQSLLAEIIFEAPRMKNAVDGLSPNLSVTISISYKCPPRSARRALFILRHR